MSIIILKTALIIYTIAIAVVMFRIVKGPSLPDRVIAFDSISAMLMSFVGVLSIVMKTTYFFEAILIIGVVSFISTIATSRFIERGVIFERKR
ncbi:Na(+)/H(+) antiporter subunit F1 [Macrococcus armenti]|uniref:Na(+)/H(+) antiporter subunit F1 n=1 Tax=Macrococcus armenti TaxID=2875764 RepID=A0ABY3ZUJ7_9STAP|nr:Na(+)/H(+) antiporter subunit F1 [Macrococcus armenti]UBH08650.1 Na(+)/H(+) antiporter subunit F1 [Macrococcus armenti]UBH10950.1 Na(+)/H(+) antiporter subunit F1 [Macrococcus armenti]UBH13166.1 Na(+)/H(+) antiporter subunit F1 [Macrococcus armenti]UBH15422.1 Na(+)/H(+) antiporter subunit F1 [Macrococcus armenti]UBH17781.1 Na(+)/H(+) antiporter subunit F1 [Macrococcus armenti]